MKPFGVAFIVFFLAGCVAAIRPTPEQLAAATYDAAPDPSAYEKAISDWAQINLKDPYSMKLFIESRATQKGYLPVCVSNDAPLCTRRMFYFGHILSASINAKNTYGGYTGLQRYYFVFRGNDVFVGYVADSMSVLNPVFVQ